MLIWGNFKWVYGKLRCIVNRSFNSRNSFSKENVMTIEQKYEDAIYAFTAEQYRVTQHKFNWLFNNSLLEVGSYPKNNINHYPGVTEVEPRHRFPIR
ncbi:MAG: hypothetical protein ACJA13_001366 [Paraglaciecola sp.]|jgi:hypothetical protein